jgi:phage tail tape-measure protein
MKYWILAVSLFVFGCSGGESDDSADADPSKTVGADVADTLNDAQQAAKDVEAMLEEKKEAIDDEVDKATDD